MQTPPSLHARQSPPPPHDLEDCKGHCNGEEAAQNMQPPKLSGPGSCTRACLAISCLLCFGMFCLIVTAAINHFPAMHATHAAAAPPPRPLPALLKRFARLKKAATPERGAARDSITELFPHWRDVEGPVRELALGVALLAQHLQPQAEPERPALESELKEDTQDL